LEAAVPHVGRRKYLKIQVVFIPDFSGILGFDLHGRKSRHSFKSRFWPGLKIDSQQKSKKMKTLELEDFGVYTLNKQELVETEGGFIPLIIVGAALLVSACASVKPMEMGGAIPMKSPELPPADSCAVDSCAIRR
jgi:lactobin A/cerein 7B family class IIb bacteriocin